MTPKTRLTLLSGLLLLLSVPLLFPSVPSQSVGILCFYNHQRQESIEKIEQTAKSIGGKKQKPKDNKQGKLFYVRA